jgi:hypothetical protein
MPLEFELGKQSWLFWRTSLRISKGVMFMQGIKEDKDAAALAVQNEAQRLVDDLGLELDKTVKVDWFKSNNVALRCLRITPKEVGSNSSMSSAVLFQVLGEDTHGTSLMTISFEKNLCMTVPSRECKAIF